jgi:hypothetical protein
VGEQIRLLQFLEIEMKKTFSYVEGDVGMKKGRKIDD